MTIALPSVLRPTYPVRIATRVVFFIAGFAMSTRAPLAAPCAHRLVCKRPIIAAACVLGATLPLLA
ncbi:hypothetical protein SGGMMB4_03688 [Sodalis glossinidius str. 'morsitans']|uniref:Uncharacterized protein n=1 Tax=Sodalis glossinidius (strain morsitans) TaxID=343509 RepID=A0A193QKH3_SODGM|nr:hypothetical protein [Sodalis glossinidius]CRL45694.1 hypothetical protein SGGMMB4_03688 [Sodalis glossinidius str. 'morsitans']